MHAKSSRSDFPKAIVILVGCFVYLRHRYFCGQGIGAHKVDVSEISKKFSEIIDLNDDKRVFSCGSGITACVLGLAYSLVNNTYSPTVYDGSWAEYGRI